LRVRLASADLLHASWYLALALAEIVHSRTGRTRARFDQYLSNPETQWGFGSASNDERYEQAAALLDALRGKSRFGTALEVGCGGGAFTEFLVDRCEGVVALDVSPLALAHARSRRKLQDRVAFKQLNLQTGSLSEQFDLIIVMDVLYYINRPWVMRACVRKLIAALHQEGHLLVGHGKGSRTVEHGRLASRFLHGASQINSLFSSDPQLTLIFVHESEQRFMSLFQKRAGVIPTRVDQGPAKEY